MAPLEVDVSYFAWGRHQKKKLVHTLLESRQVTLINPCLQICKVIQHVAKKERLTVPPHYQLLLARLSGGNLRRALLSFEALSVQDPSFSKIKPDVIEGENLLKVENLDVIPRPDWEKYCSQVAARILSEQSPDRLLEVRGMLYELLVHCIPANTILSVRHIIDARTLDYLIELSNDFADCRETHNGPDRRIA